VSAVAASAREPAAFDLGLVIASWAVVLDVVKNTTRVGYTLLVDTIPVSQSGTTLVIAHPDSSRLEQLRARAGVMEMVREAVFNVLHLELDLDYVLDPGRATSTVAPAAEPQSLGDNNGSYIDTAMQQQPSARARAEALVASENAVPAADDLPSDDDEDVDDSGLTGLALIERELGGTIMTEYDNG
jgi:DNA polymerase-3 subunit gamma/tau